MLLSLAGVTFAGYLTFVELAVIKAVCPYCVVLALLMMGILVIVLMQRPLAPNVSGGRLAFIGGLVVVLVLAVAALLPRTAVQAPAQTDYQARLAKHLTDSGAVIYGAWWGPRCADQKEMFGKAFAYVNYVECDPKGQNANPQLCRDMGIKLFPTWDINGQRHEGVLSLSQLAALTGFSE